MKKCIVRTLLAVILLACLILPVGTVYAETPLSLGIVADDGAAEGLGSPFQHHSFTADGVMWVFYQATGLNSILCSWSEDGTTWVAHAPIRYCNGSTAGTKGGQFDTWYHIADDTVHFAVVNTSVNGSDVLFAKYVINATAHTLTIDGAWVTAAAGSANSSYRNPTICVNNNDQDFITYGNVTSGASDVYVISTNDSTDDPWILETGFPMNNLSANASRPTQYGSVIPLYTSNNVSVQCAAYNGSQYKLIQTNVVWNGSSWTRVAATQVDSSSWYLPSMFEWNYNAVSIDTSINDNDVAIQCLQTDGSDYRVFFNRRGNESDIWAATYARNFGAGSWGSLYVGAMGIRNAIYSIVYSGWDNVALSTNISSNDFDAVTGDWDGIAVVDSDTDIPLVSTMSDYTYDPSGTGYIGFLYGTTTNNRLMYGLYGPAVPPVIPTVVSDFINATGMIVSLIISFLLIVLLLGIAFKEGMNNGWNEGTKLAMTAIIGIIVIETIIIQFF
jgi:hypothetical protein